MKSGLLAARQLVPHAVGHVVGGGVGERKGMPVSPVEEVHIDLMCVQ